MFGAFASGGDFSENSVFASAPSAKNEQSNTRVQNWIVPFTLLREQTCQLHRLSIDECEKASRMKIVQNAQDYALSRSFLRVVLASEMHCEPGDIYFQYGTNGKPFVEGGLKFNLSHCNQLLVVAIANNEFNGHIGVDVEARVNEPECLSLAEKCFTPLERRQLSTYEVGALQHAAFTRGWTRKEAVVKALGLGLQAPLDAFDVALDSAQVGNGCTSLLLASMLKDVSVEQCELYDLGCRQDCEISLAVIHQAKAMTSEVITHDVDQHQLDALMGLWCG